MYIIIIIIRSNELNKICTRCNKPIFSSYSICYSCGIKEIHIECKTVKESESQLFICPDCIEVRHLQNLNEKLV